MIAPGLIYAFFTRTDPVALRGWAIPTATDIAFALGVLALLGNRVPTALKAFLLSVAIFDDTGAVAIIAIFFTDRLSGVALGFAGGAIAVLAFLNRLGVMRPAAYILLGISLWIAVLKSGVHATLAGVVLAMFIPLRGKGSQGTGESAASPLRQLEHLLHPWVATRLRITALPQAMGWSQVYGVSLLCGIGFTMSLFMATLAVGAGNPFNGLERLGILIATMLSGLAGALMLRATLRP